MNCRNKITSLALVLVGSCYGLTASAKCGSVDYTQGADALAMMHDYVVTMMLYVLLRMPLQLSWLLFLRYRYTSR